MNNSDTSHPPGTASDTLVSNRSTNGSSLPDQSPREWHEILKSMPDMVMVVNQHRQIVFANESFKEFCKSRGLACADGLKPGQVFDCPNASYAPDGCGTCEACKTCGAIHTILSGLDGKPSSNECRIVSGTAGALDFRLWAHPLSWDEQNGAIVTISDISDHKRRKSLEKIFFHDILNTAGNIFSMTELLKEEPSLVYALKDDLHHAAVTLVGEIGSQRLLLAAENNELHITSSQLWSRSCIESAAAQFRSHPVAKDKNLVISEDSENHPFQTDESLIQRVLCNMIKNAIEATANGQTVTIGTRREDRHLVFWCHNPGFIPHEIQWQVFQRNFSTKGSGRGLGTYSIRLLTERYLGGKADFLSSEEEGTIFLIRLPLVLPAHGNLSPPASNHY